MRIPQRPCDRASNPCAKKIGNKNAAIMIAAPTIDTSTSAIHCPTVRLPGGCSARANGLFTKRRSGSSTGGWGGGGGDCPLEVIRRSARSRRADGLVLLIARELLELVGGVLLPVGP